MTRTYVDHPVWTWKCDDCGRTSGDLATLQTQLPTPAVMAERGWFIAPLWGDLCPTCRLKPEAIS